MNTDEIAEKLLDCLSAEDRLEIRSKAAQMLRQQQAEIDKLKNLLLDNQILLDKTLNAWAKEMERK
jgi:hypothetical protein